MLFNSLQFAVFFVIVYTLYLVLSHKWRNRMLLAASYVFYGAWDWRFLSLIFISTYLDYFCGLKIDESENIGRRKLFLWFSIVGNLTLLGFFKYFNFFAANLQFLLGRFGLNISPLFLNIILPVGISFYTFQTMSYTLDIYRRQLRPTKSLPDFALFVAYFPQLVAGPILRARDLLPQILAPRKLTLEKFYEGSYLITWGFFQKIFVADNLGRIVDPVFAAAGPYNGLAVLVALYAFAFQIYCDFAAYSNIARGLGSCMGFDIMVNFNLPYFAVNPRDFWKRWHISLSTWLRDYLYIPLGGNKRGAFILYRNLAITMFLGGLWHGAAWTYVLWGVYHGALLIIHRLLEPFVKGAILIKGVVAEKAWHVVRIIFFFHLVCLSWLLFRSTSVRQAVDMFKAMISNLYIDPTIRGYFLKLIFFVSILSIFEIFQYLRNDQTFIRRADAGMRTAAYLAIIYLIIIYGAFGGKEFIYFQF